MTHGLYEAGPGAVLRGEPIDEPPHDEPPKIDEPVPPNVFPAESLLHSRGVYSPGPGIWEARSSSWSSYILRRAGRGSNRSACRFSIAARLSSCMRRSLASSCAIFRKRAARATSASSAALARAFTPRSCRLVASAGRADNEPLFTLDMPRLASASSLQRVCWSAKTTFVTWAT